jgi:glycosyltransferase involved in cell wall biosynthesis
MIPKSIAEHVLLVGPDYKDHRGGIGAVIAVHKDQYEAFNFIATHRPLKSSLLKALYFIRQFVKITFFLATHRRIKVVHIHSSKQGSFYRKLLVAIIAKVIFRRKTINHIHSGNFRRFYDGSNVIGKKLISFFLRLNDVTITVSDLWKEYFETAFRLKNVYRINNIINSPVNGSALSTYTKNGAVHFLFLGMIHPDKGIFDLLQVLRDHKAALANKLKLFIGGNGQVDKLQALIEAGGLQGIVTFKGWVTGHEKENLLQFADVFVLPSYYEGSPVAMLEAMSYGKPVISTTVGGIPEIVEPGLNGWLHRPGDHEALLNALLYYINEPENIKKHGERSSRIIKNYYPETIVPQLNSVYNSLL